MPGSRFDRQRLSALEELLQLDYGKLSSFEQELTLTSSAPAKFELQTRIQKEVVPKLREHEREYAQLVAAGVRPETMPEAEAAALVDQTLNALEAIDTRVPPSAKPKVLQLAADLRQELQKPGTAAAKLKVSLPIIPLIASYELELQTGGLMVQAWKHVKEFFAGSVESPP